VTARAPARWQTVGLAVLGLAAAALLAYLYLPGPARTWSAADERTASEVGAWLAGALSAELRQLEGAVAREAPDRLLAAGDPAALQAAQARLAGAHPDTLRVWILRAGHDRVDYTVQPPLTYAAVSLLQRSETQGKTPPPEAQLIGSEQQQVVVPVRVEGPQGLLGHVLFSLNPVLVQRLLDGMPWPGGAAKVLQPVAGASPVVLAARGKANSGAPLTREIAGTGWRVAYQPARTEAAEPSATAGSALWVALAVAALLAGALGLWLFQRRGQGAPAPATEEDAEAPVDWSRPARTGGADLPEGPPPLPSVEELSAEEEPAVPEGGPPEPAAQGLPAASIFLPYDVRGVVGDTLNADVARALGRAIGSEAYDRGQQALVVGRDGRTSSPELARALIEGLVDSGRDVIDVGQAPTPVVYFAAEYLDAHSAVVVTGSHNPANYNGFKVVLGGETLAEGAIANLRRRLATGDLVVGAGSVQSLEMDAEYIRRVAEDIPAALGNPYRVVVDAGNGVAGEIAPRLYRALGHDVVEVHCEVDGTFPSHPPDPSQPENLTDLLRAVKEHQADIGFAFDGDGDRLFVVDGEGRVIWPDRLLMLYAFDVLSRNAGATVVYDVKCTARLGKVIAKLGGKPLMWKAGHALVKAKMRETGALLAGEGSGHIYIRDRWYGFDDALYAGARLLDILRGRGAAPAAVFAKLPTGVATPELRVPMSRERAAEVVAALASDAFPGARVTDLDGLRADYPDAWGLVRGSNTTPHLLLRFEGDDQEALARVQGAFRRALLAAAPDLALPF
jgi:phosphomannomutase/phosphoglucomutase